jgi:hypothetical protein
MPGYLRPPCWPCGSAYTSRTERCKAWQRGVVQATARLRSRSMLNVPGTPCLSSIVQPVTRFRMNVNEINAYVQRTREIIGERSQSEIAYDDSVVAHLSRGKDIKRAIRAANQEHPEEALKPGPEHWADLAARYEYILEHKAILKTLGMKE